MKGLAVLQVDAIVREIGAILERLGIGGQLAQRFLYSVSYQMHRQEILQSALAAIVLVWLQDRYEESVQEQQPRGFWSRFWRHESRIAAEELARRNARREIEEMLELFMQVSQLQLQASMDRRLALLRELAALDSQNGQGLGGVLRGLLGQADRQALE